MVRSDLAEFQKSFNRLCLAFGRAPSDETFDVFFRALERFAIETIVVAIDKIIALGGTFPYPAKIGEMASSIVSQRVNNLPEKPEPGERKYQKQELRDLIQAIAKTPGAAEIQRVAKGAGMTSVGAALMQSLRIIPAEPEPPKPKKKTLAERMREASNGSS